MFPDNERRSSFPAKSSSYLLNRGKAVLGVGRETFEDNSIPGMLKVWRKLARIYRVHGQPLERLSPGRFILKRPYAGDHFVEHQPQGIDVAGGCQLFSLDLLRGHVGGSPKDAALGGENAGGVFDAPHPAGDAKVGDYRSYFLTRADQHHVTAFEIAVQDARAMGRTQCLAEL